MNILQKLIEKIPASEEDETTPPPMAVYAPERSAAKTHGMRDVLPITLGTCADGTPVRIDVNDPELQPMALISNSNDENTQLFGQILRNIMDEYDASDVQFALLKRRSSQWTGVLAEAEERGISLGVDTISPRSEWEFLYQASEMAEQRHQGQEALTPPLVILIEDLSVLAHASSDFRLNFEWLCMYGPAVGVHLLAAITTEDALKLGRWLRYFPVRLLGSMSAVYGQRFGLHSALPPVPRSLRGNGLIPGAGTVFAVWSGTDWLYFSLPRPAAARRNNYEAMIGDDE